MKPIPMLDLSAEIESLWPDLQAAVERVLRSGRYILGPEVEAFEREAAAWLGVEHAIGVNSGTDALVIALRALGIGPGDEVITTPFSFFATAEAISIAGAQPVFVDIEEESFNIDPERVEAAITARTRAIVPVHLFGRPARMAPLLELAAHRGLHVVEDCAQSFGATLGTTLDSIVDTASGTARAGSGVGAHADSGVGARGGSGAGAHGGSGAGAHGGSSAGARAGSRVGPCVGSLGAAGAFSFFPTKNLGACGDGGLIATNDGEVAALARMLGNHGSRERNRHEMPGMNSRLDALQAAILRLKLPHVDEWNEARRAAAGSYNELFAGAPGIVVPEVTPGHVFHQYTIRITGGERGRVQARLAEQGIASSAFYAVPQDRQPVYAGGGGTNPVSDRLAGEVLSLPLWPDMEAGLQRRVASAVLG